MVQMQKNVRDTKTRDNDQDAKLRKEMPDA